MDERPADRPPVNQKLYFTIVALGAIAALFVIATMIGQAKGLLS